MAAWPYDRWWSLTIPVNHGADPLGVPPRLDRAEQHRLRRFEPLGLDMTAELGGRARHRSWRPAAAAGSRAGPVPPRRCRRCPARSAGRAGRRRTGAASTGSRSPTRSHDPIRTRPAARRRRPPPRSARRGWRCSAAAARRRAKPDRCSRSAIPRRMLSISCGRSTAGSGRLSVTLIAPSSPTVASWVRTFSSPSTHAPSDTRNFQLCQAHVSRSPSRSPCVRP